jgi:hypothetical protein
MWSQRIDAWSIGTGFDLDRHDAQFAKPMQVSLCCPSDYSSFGGGNLYATVGVGISPTRSLSGIMDLSIAAGLGYRWADAYQQSTSYINDPITNRGIEGGIEYVMNYRRTELLLDIAPRFWLTAPLSLSAGVRIAYNVATKLTSREQLSDALIAQGYHFVDPSSGTMTTTRNVYDGQLQNAIPFNVSVYTGLSYDIPADTSSRLLITPSVWYRYQPMGFTDALVSRTIGQQSTNPTWMIHSAGLSVAVSMRNPKNVEMKEQAPVPPCHVQDGGTVVALRCIDGSLAIYDPKRDTCLCPEVPTIVPTVAAIRGVFAIQRGSREKTPLAQITVLRRGYVRFMPIVNMVSFKGRSANIDLRNAYLEYTSSSARRVEQTEGFAMSYQRHVLNLLGQAYRDGKLKRLTLVACPAVGEDADTLLNKERCLTVREYLYRRWNVPFAAFTIRPPTVAEVDGVRESLPALRSSGIVIIYRDETDNLVEYVSTTDTLIDIEPDTLRIEAQLQLPEVTGSVTSEWQLRLGGVTIGDASSVVVERRSVDSAKDVDQISSITIPLVDEEGRPRLGLDRIGATTSAKVIPSLRVSTPDGVVVAKRDNATSVVPVRVEDSRSKSDPTSNDAVLIGTIELPRSSMLGRLQARALTGLLGTIQRPRSDWEVSLMSKQMINDLQDVQQSLRPSVIKTDNPHGLTVELAVRVGAKLTK